MLMKKLFKDTSKKRRKLLITLLSVFLVLLISVLYLTAGPSETNKMEQALVNACNLEGREFNDAVNEISGQLFA